MNTAHSDRPMSGVTRFEAFHLVSHISLNMTAETVHQCTGVEKRCKRLRL